MESNLARLLEYSSSLANEFKARRNRIRAFVPNHKPSAGYANESILRDFLSGLCTTRYAVGQGFICDPANPEVASRQCDIFLYDQHDYPLVYSEAGIQVVFPQAVKMLVEVKTSLKRESLCDALENIRAAKQMNSAINGVIFAFGSSAVTTVVENLRGTTAASPLREAPVAILLLDQGAIIHRGLDTEFGGGDRPYTVCAARRDKARVVMAYLLLLFFDILMLGSWGGAEIANLRGELLAECICTPLIA